MTIDCIHAAVQAASIAGTLRGTCAGLHGNPGQFGALNEQVQQSALPVALQVRVFCDAAAASQLAELRAQPPYTSGPWEAHHHCHHKYGATGLLSIGIITGPCEHTCCQCLW
jgi:hypothetical protein